jgi:hypothetical protein
MRSNHPDIVHPNAQRVAEVVPLPIRSFEAPHNNSCTFIWSTMMLQVVDPIVSERKLRGSKNCGLLDHLIGDSEQSWRETDAECLGGSEIDLVV